MLYRSQRARAIALVLFVFFLSIIFAAPALAQDSDAVGGITAFVVAVIGFLATFVSRWTQTNPANAWYVRASRVLDLTQVIDSTRSLGDE